MSPLKRDRGRSAAVEEAVEEAVAAVPGSHTSGARSS
ncbi:hypothetical protein LMG26411_04950 [Cupriavidus numazuensis]|uniref:Uncharacterized protein n=1 Tax=Cupriavidus numazuensis TaxID=221992 RepID=A0ABM8TMY6_9BURK|nr:hypothetical protein LMG26411_04950 [Cupriavidus numazuensis]